MAVSWVVAPCSLVEVYQRLRCACYQTTRRYNPEDSHLHSILQFNVGSCIPYGFTFSKKCIYYFVEARLVSNVKLQHGEHANYVYTILFDWWAIEVGRVVFCVATDLIMVGFCEDGNEIGLHRSWRMSSPGERRTLFHVVSYIDHKHIYISIL
jgi:hypothetical protein